MRIGSFTVTVTEIPGRSMTQREWRNILLARRSYAAMWGGGTSDVVTHDPFDGLDESPYAAWHYVAWVRDGADPWKLVTMRKVALIPAELTPEQRADPSDLLPDDIRLWSVDTDAGRIPLWNALRDHARKLAPDDEQAEFLIASTGRTGTFPYGERQVTARQRERTGIAFATIQLLAMQDDPSPFYVATLCAEFRDRVLGVHDVAGTYVTTDHTPTETVLGLRPGTVHMDNDLPVVRERKTFFPGYFIDNDDAARVLAGLLDGGRIAVEDLHPTILSIVAGETALGRSRHQVEELVRLLTRPDHARMARLLTRPNLFKYLIPRLVSDRPLARMSAEELRDHVVCRTKDGPYSSTLILADWAANAWSILAAAEGKYA